MPDGKAYVPSAEAKPRSKEKRKATASGLAAALSRMKGKKEADD
jgi:hypothetical protein